MSSKAPIWRRWVPLLAVGLGVAAFFALGLQHYLSFDALARRYGELEVWRAQNPWAFAIGAGAIYALLVALSIPVGTILTLALGLLFGWALGAGIAVVAATIGAMALFVVARFALADFFRARAGAWLNRFADGFRDDAASYLLFLRLAPIVPFSVLNIVPAILGVKFFTFAWTTFLGVIPGTLAYGFAGEGLRSIIAARADACAHNIAPCGEPIEMGELITREILIAFAALALVALLPVVIRRFRPHKSPLTRP